MRPPWTQLLGILDIKSAVVAYMRQWRDVLPGIISGEGRFLTADRQAIRRRYPEDIYFGGWALTLSPAYEYSTYKERKKPHIKG